MKRFLITSPRFSGQAEIVYSDREILCKIDCTDTDMNAQTIKAFKAAVPATTDFLAQSFSPETVIVEADYEVSFETFWKKYDNKVNRKRALALWKKLNKTTQVKAYFGIEPYKKWLKKSGRYEIDADGYLKNEYWENQYK